MSAAERKPPKRRRARLTIGYLAPALHGGHQAQWGGVVGAAQDHGVNLICFPGWSLHDPRGFQAQANILYDLAGAGNLDGLISWASSIGNYVDSAEIGAFHQRYRPLPMVCIGGKPLEGVPALLMDSYKGMRELMAHLIEVHGYRRLAFVRGPEGHFSAQERYRAYGDALQAYGIPLDPNLVTPPFHWGPSMGMQAMRLLLDERRLRPQTDFQAVVVSSDDLALGALEVLNERKIRVPADLAITGFDNTAEGRQSVPPLTSATAPYRELGWQAVETLLERMKGAQIPEEIMVPSTLVARRSCGCLDPAVVQAAAGPVEASPETLDVALREKRKELVAALAQASSTAGPIAPWAEQLLDAFCGELRGEPAGLFLDALDEVLRQVVASAKDVADMQNVVSTLRRSVLPYLGGEALAQARDLWEQARVLIGETAQRAQAYQTLQNKRQAQALRQVGQALLTTFDVEELTNVLAEELPRLGVPSCYLALYEDSRPYAYPQPAPEWSRLILAYIEGRRIELEPDGRRFRSRQLVPAGLWPRAKQHCSVVAPLYFRQQQIGFALFEVGPRDGGTYETLRGQISSALQGALLLRARHEAERALQEAYAEVERQVELRTAELRHEIAERERAQEENIRLQQEIIEAQNKALLELSTPIIPVLEGVIVMPLIGSVDTIRARDIMRRLLAGIREHRARVVILDVTGVPVIDSGVANHLNKAIQAVRLKGARPIVTGISDEVAETIVDLGIDWSEVETLSDLQTGLRAALVEVRPSAKA